MSQSIKSTPPNLEDIKQWVSAILAEVNIGLLIYHLEDAADSKSLRLLYTNKAASEFTGADLSQLEGKRILDAFPALADGELPEAYADVVRNGRSIELGTTEYGGDDRVEQGFYSVKAFPMPSQCVGVIFENITVRKKVEELVKKERERSK